MNRLLLTGLLLLLPVLPASADTDGLSQEMLDLLERMKQFETAQEQERSAHDQERSAMQREIDELRTRTDDNWLTERRVEEIQEIVQDVLADADTRSNLLQDGLMAGWSEHFFLASPDGRFKLVVEGHMQMRWLYRYKENGDSHRQGFENSRSKLTLRGHVFRPEIQYLFRTDATRNEPGLVNGLYFVRDMWIRYLFDDTWSVRMGQFKLPFNREELVSSAYQQAIERSLINENNNLGRSEGVELTYSGNQTKWSMAISDGATDSYGGFGNLIGTFPVNTDALDQDVEYALTVRHERLLAGEWRQFEDMTSRPNEEFGMLFGIAGHIQKGENTSGFSVSRNEQFVIATTADLSIEWGGANFFTSFNYAFIDHGNFGDFDLYGLVVQGGYYLTPKWEMYARWEYGWWQFANLNVTDLNVATIGVNYYLDGHDLKLSADFGWAFNEVDQVFDSSLAGWSTDQNGSKPQVVFRTQFQLMF